MDECPACGKMTFTWSTYTDYCTDPACGYEFGYPSIHTARPGTISQADVDHHPDFKED